MKHLVKKRYTTARPRVINVRKMQTDEPSTTKTEESSCRSMGSAEKKLNFGNIATGLSNPIVSSTLLAPENNRNDGSDSVAHFSGTFVAEKPTGSTSSLYLNASYLISNYYASARNNTHLSSTDGRQLGSRPSPEQLGLDKKLLAALQRMEQIQGRIHTLESKFKSMDQCILTEVSTSKVITQPSELTSTARAVTQPPGPEPTSTANTVTQPPEPQPIVKEWHHEITLTIREHLITKFTKLTNLLLPTTPNTAKIGAAVEQCTRKAEKKIFETANSKAEYYRTMDERYYILSKQLEEKRKALQQNPR